jgi:hypothetical protein
MQSGGFLTSRSANRIIPETAYKTLFFRLSKMKGIKMKIEQQFETEIFINEAESITIKQNKWPEDDQLIVISYEYLTQVINELKSLRAELRLIRRGANDTQF